MSTYRTAEQLLDLGQRWGLDPNSKPCFSIDDPALRHLMGDVSVKTIRRKIKRGDLPAVAVSERRIVVMTGDLIEYLANRRSTLPPAESRPLAPIIKRGRGRPRKQALVPRGL
jgi:hypothetical protein